ncbi:MAG TPA: AbrB/MazE/SpoVT family DNA-binding domain-containing protein [Candidatus Anoxymicrobiaceae bacterium]
MDTATVSSKYQVVVPKKAREVLGIKSGDKLIFDYRDGVVALLAKPSDFVEFMRGLGSEVWKCVDVTEYLTGERET